MAVKFDAVLDFRVAGEPEKRMQNVARHAKEAGEAAQGSVFGIGRAWDQATGAIGRLHPALAGTAVAAGEAGGAVTGLTSLAMNPLTLAALGAAGAVGGVGLVLGGMAATAVEVNQEIERAGRSIGAAINASYQFGTEGRDHAKNYAMAMGFAGGVVDRLQEKQMALGETMPTLAQGYLKMVPAAERAGMGTEAVWELMEKSTLAAKALGIGSEEAYDSVQAFMETGMARGAFLKQLGLAGEKFSQMGARERYRAIIDRMGEMETAGREAAQSMGNVWASTWDDMKDTVGIAARGMSDEVGAFVKDLAAFWQANKDTFTKAFEDIAAVGTKVFSGLRTTVGLFAEGVADATEITSKLSGAARAPGRMGGYRAEGVIGAILPGYGFEDAKRAQEQWWDQLIKDVREGRMKPTEARARAEDFMQAIAPGDVWARQIAIEKSRALGQAQPLPTANVQVTQNFNGPINIKQDFRDQDPDRVGVVLQRDLSRLAQVRRQSGFAPAFGF